MVAVAQWILSLNFCLDENGRIISQKLKLTMWAVIINDSSILLNVKSVFPNCIFTHMFFEELLRNIKNPMDICSELQFIGEHLSMLNNDISDESIDSEPKKKKQIDFLCNQLIMHANKFRGNRFDPSNI